MRSEGIARRSEARKGRRRLVNTGKKGADVCRAGPAGKDDLSGGGHMDTRRIRVQGAESTSMRSLELLDGYLLVRIEPTCAKVASKSPEGRRLLALAIPRFHPISVHEAHWSRLAGETCLCKPSLYRYEHDVSWTSVCVRACAGATHIKVHCIKCSVARARALVRAATRNP